MRRVVAVLLVIAIVVTGCFGPTIKSNVDHATVVEIMPTKDATGQPVRRNLGSTPCRTELSRGGPHRVEVSAPGYRTEVRVVRAHQSEGLVVLAIVGVVLLTCCSLLGGALVYVAVGPFDDPGFCAVFDDADLHFALVPGTDLPEPRHEYSVPEPLPSPSPTPTPSPSPRPSPSPSPRPRPSPSPLPTPSPTSTSPSSPSMESPASGSLTKFCTHCGVKFASDEQRFCTGCGAAR